MLNQDISIHCCLWIPIIQQGEILKKSCYLVVSGKLIQGLDFSSNGRYIIFISIECHVDTSWLWKNTQIILVICHFFHKCVWTWHPWYILCQHEFIQNAWGSVYGIRSFVPSYSVSCSSFIFHLVGLYAAWFQWWRTRNELCYRVRVENRYCISIPLRPYVTFIVFSILVLFY